MQPRRDANALWYRGQELAAEGRKEDAMKAFAAAAQADEAVGKTLKAFARWEAMVKIYGADGYLLERCARCAERLDLGANAYVYWAASAAAYHRQGLAREAAAARVHALILREEGHAPSQGSAWTAPPIPMQILVKHRHEELVRDLLW